MEKLLRQAEAEAIRAQVFWFTVELIALVVFFVVLYFVIKAAVREGIKEAGLAETIKTLRTPIEEPTLPPMRADR